MQIIAGGICRRWAAELRAIEVALPLTTAGRCNAPVTLFNGGINSEPQSQVQCVHFMFYAVTNLPYRVMDMPHNVVSIMTPLDIS